MLRIISGHLRGRRIHAPENNRKTRPTLDRVRETIFNILIHNQSCPILEGAVVLDLFAGSGSLGFEALSRGAAHVTFVDQDMTSLACCKKNASHLGVDQWVTFCRGDTRSVRLKTPFDLVLIDPPYYKGMSEPTLVNVRDQSALTPAGVIALEMAADETLKLPDGFDVIKETTCGPGRLYFLKLLEAAPHVGSPR